MPLVVSGGRQEIALVTKETRHSENWYLLFMPAALMAVSPASVRDTPSEAHSANAGPSTSFAVQDQTEIPGRTLRAGSYRIRVVDHLKDRMIIAVDQPGKKQTVFLALPKIYPRLRTGGHRTSRWN